MLKRHTQLGAALGLAVTLAACGTDDGGGGGDGAGGTVEILGGFQTVDAERFEAALAPFEERTGIDVKYVGEQDFETLVVTRAEGGDPPDIAIFPQPGLLADLAQSGKVTALDDIVDGDQLADDLVPGLLDASTVDDQLMGVPYRLAVKSLVWYPKDAWTEAGYAEPETLDDLRSLIEQIKADGGTPFCLGAEDGPGTGWVVTDWFEDLVLRLHGPDLYDEWVAHELPFDSSEVQQVGDTFAELAFEEGNVVGNRDGILNISFRDSPQGLFQDPPGCMMHRQGNFVTAFFPEDTDIDQEVGVFYFPSAAEGPQAGQRPILGGGDIAALMVDSPEARKVIEYLASAESNQSWVEAGGYFSPHTTIDVADYPDETSREIAEMLTSGTSFRFDASDLMPGAVGTGSFWQQMVAWINGEKSLSEALATIDESWPSS